MVTDHQRAAHLHTTPFKHNSVKQGHRV
uniref:Uncharacterized protein n=1 Tax=Anguilla anguilla TaxID=7936 RepID=A0A0E9RX66_ANGAN